jgi:hypothetical protein
VFSAIILWKPIPTPSITARRMAHPIAPFRIARGPPRTASAPPVKKPAMMAFQGSSFLRTPLTAQSKLLNMPPHTPKLPPSTGARALMAVIAVRTVLSVVEQILAATHRTLRRTTKHSFVVGAVPETLDAVPYCSSYCLFPVSVSFVHYYLMFLETIERTPMQKAPPKSDKATQGQGSRE